MLYLIFIYVNFSYLSGYKTNISPSPLNQHIINHHLISTSSSPLNQHIIITTQQTHHHHSTNISSSPLNENIIIITTQRKHYHHHNSTNTSSSPLNQHTPTTQLLTVVTVYDMLLTAQVFDNLNTGALCSADMTAIRECKLLRS